MSPKHTDFPPIRACLFDMDGLLLNTEDIYTTCINQTLAKYNRPPMPWSVKAQLQGRPGPAANDIFHAWAQLPIPREQFNDDYTGLQARLFPTAAPLPGVEKLLQDLSTARTKTDKEAAATGGKIHMALATSSHTENFKRKTAHLGHLFDVFEERRRVVGDDSRIAQGKGKPAPDIYLLALQMVNETLPSGEAPVKPEECLVFEDAIPGVESGRRAGMRVVWCPHPGLAAAFKGREEEVLAGRIGGGPENEGVECPGEIGDGWAEQLATLENFPYEKYGIII